VSLGRAAVALLCGALVALPGCGSSNNGTPIPASQGDRLTKAIQAADQYSAAGRCDRAHTKVRDARFLLGQIPNSVDSSVRQGIADGLSRLDSLISSQCQRPAQTQTDTTPTETRTTQTQTDTTTTPTTTTPTDTSPTGTTLTTTTPTTTTPTTTGTGTTTTGGNGGTTTTGGNGGTPPGAGTGNQG
jgi:hypothetical protein